MQIRRPFATLATKTFPRVTQAQYEKLYAESIADPATFWAKEAAKDFEWTKPFNPSKVVDFDFVNPRVAWFEGGKTNVSVAPPSSPRSPGSSDRVLGRVLSPSLPPA